MQIPKCARIGPTRRAVRHALVVLIKRHPELRGFNEADQNRDNPQAVRADLQPDADREPLRRLDEKKGREESADDEYDGFTDDAEQVQRGLIGRQMLGTGGWNVTSGSAPENKCCIILLVRLKSDCPRARPKPTPPYYIKTFG